ncbi:hypothetical protein GCM10020331_101030 [Ectobacillus funiculus]
MQLIMLNLKGIGAKKVFQITETEIKKAGRLNLIHEKHSFKDLTTRKHYEGVHSLSIIINGAVKMHLIFMVK